MSQRKKTVLLLIIVIILMLIIVFLVGNSFGFFRYIKKGETVNIITINGIETKILNAEKEALFLENSYPISDSEALNLTPFEFQMTNTSTRSLSYLIRIDLDDEKMKDCVLEDNTQCPELSTNYIKYAYKKNDGTYTEPRNLGEDNNTITTGIISGKESIISSIILWIDQEAGNEIMNHYFYGKVIVTGEQAQNQ